MGPGMVMEIARQAIQATIFLVGPLLLASLIVGLVVSIFQAATQINESTLQFVPKLFSIFLVLIFGGPWLIQYMVNYMTELFNSIPQLIG